MRIKPTILSFGARGYWAYMTVLPKANLPALNLNTNLTYISVITHTHQSMGDFPHVSRHKKWDTFDMPNKDALSGAGTLPRKVLHSDPVDSSLTSLTRGQWKHAYLDAANLTPLSQRTHKLINKKIHNKWAWGGWSREFKHYIAWPKKENSDTCS